MEHRPREECQRQEGGGGRSAGGHRDLGQPRRASMPMSAPAMGPRCIRRMTGATSRRPVRVLCPDEAIRQVETRLSPVLRGQCRHHAVTGRICFQPVVASQVRQHASPLPRAGSRSTCWLFATCLCRSVAALACSSAVRTANSAFGLSTAQGIEQIAAQDTHRLAVHRKNAVRLHSTEQSADGFDDQAQVVGNVTARHR